MESAQDPLDIIDQWSSHGGRAQRIIIEKVDSKHEMVFRVGSKR